MPALWGNVRMLCGLVEAARVLGRNDLLRIARKLGDFYVDILPRFTDPARLAEYEGGYVNPAGGLLEKCQTTFERDEGCALADWLRLNLELGRLTGNLRYYEMAERLLHNQYLQNQGATGGFGHRYVTCDKEGVTGFEDRFQEATWCCDFHGLFGLRLLGNYLVLDQGEHGVRIPFALDFESSAIASKTKTGQQSGEALRQTVRLAQPDRIGVRKPAWADSVQVLDAKGESLKTTEAAGWIETLQPVKEAVFVFNGGRYLEDRKGRRLTDQPSRKGYVIGLGPKLAFSEASGTKMFVQPAPEKSQKKSADYRR